MKHTVVIGISSGIAAYKTIDLIKELRSKKIDVKVVMTSHATKMIPHVEFEKISGNPVFTSLYPEGFDYKKVIKEKSVDHIDLADSADVFVITPATANTIAKLAHGIADDILTTTALAVTAPIIVCPSMNINMWNNPVVQTNLKILKERGYIIIDPEEGPLACGYNGTGRLASLPTIQEEILKQLKRTTSLQGKRILITTGGTIEPIDDVRSITNKSSGKMGVAVAEACYLRGAQITLLRAEHSVVPRYIMPTETFTTAEDLQKKILHYLLTTDIIFHVAAVADFSIEKNPGKLSSTTHHSLSLKPQVKILDQIKKLNPNVFLVAFKVEFGLTDKELTKKAHTRLIKSQADAIVANDTSKNDRGFTSETNEVWVVTKTQVPFKIALTTKKQVAEQLLEYLF